MSDSEENPNDILIDSQKMNEFFFMDSDQEEQKYGASTKASMALSGSFVKESQQQKVSFDPFISDLEIPF